MPVLRLNAPICNKIRRLAGPFSPRSINRGYESELVIIRGYVYKNPVLGGYAVLSSINRISLYIRRIMGLCLMYNAC